ncbi:unnamed protein product [Linum trigynum]|uniref:imidazoleglycerol-phosphate dehydratase n=1 Tax=Linum trigynum TaxID=586398 RepID=A0AAV2ESZ7_9ROSI
MEHDVVQDNRMRRVSENWVSVAAAAPIGDNGSSSISTASPLQPVGSRVGEVKRLTKETNVSVKINLDGTGVADSSTGIPFLDHMLDQLASHGLFDVHVRATGDIHIDDHHTNEDVALAIGSDFESYQQRELGNWSGKRVS